MDGAEADGIVDRWLQRRRGRLRPADGEVAQLERAPLDQGHVDRMLDASDPVALGGRQLQHVLSRCQGRAGREHQRRWNGSARRREPFGCGLTFDDAAVAVRDHVRHGHALRRAVRLAYVSMNQQFYWKDRDPGN